MLIWIHPSPLWVLIWSRLCLFAWLSWLWGKPGSVVSLVRPRNLPDCWSRALRDPPAIPSTLLSVSPMLWVGAGVEPDAGWCPAGLTGTLRRPVGLGVECRRGSLCLHFAPGHGWTLGTPRRQVRSCLRSCHGYATVDGLCGPGAPPCLCSCCPGSFLPRRAVSFLLCPGCVSSPTRPTDSSPTGRSSSRSPVPALGPCHRRSPSLCSPAGETACCLLVWCSAGCRWGRNGIPPLVGADVTVTTSSKSDWKAPSGRLHRKGQKE